MDIITLVCTNCKHENYISKKNKRTHPDRMELHKYCPNCNQAVVHREKKK